MHETVGSRPRPGLLKFQGCSRRLFLDTRGPDLFGFSSGQWYDGGTEEQEHEGNPAGKHNEGGGDPGETDAATAHRRDLVAAGEQSKRQECGHQDGQGGDLEGNSGSLEQEISQDIEPTRVVTQEAAHLFEEIDHEINRHQASEAHGKDFGVLAQEITEENGHRVTGGS